MCIQCIRPKYCIKSKFRATPDVFWRNYLLPVKCRTVCFLSYGLIISVFFSIPAWWSLELRLLWLCFFSVKTFRAGLCARLRVRVPTPHSVFFDPRRENKLGPPPFGLVLQVRQCACTGSCVFVRACKKNKGESFFATLNGSHMGWTWTSSNELFGNKSAYQSRWL